MWYDWQFAMTSIPLFPEGKVALERIGAFVQPQAAAADVAGEREQQSGDRTVGTTATT